MKSPAFQFYPDKWQTDTRRLSWEAKGIFHELMCVVWMQFQETCAFPDDDEFISSEIGCTVDEWTRVKVELLNPHRPILKKKGTNRLLIQGLLKESIKQQDRREKLRHNGMLGGRPQNQKVICENQKVISEKPKHKPGSGNQNESLPSPSPSPSPIVGGEPAHEGYSEIPTFEQAFAMTMNAGILKDFCKYVYDDWSSRSGKDGGGNVVSWLPYVTKRWARESVEWRAGTHKGNRSAPSGNSGIDKVVLNRNLTELEASLRRLSEQYEGHQSWSAADIAERKRLKGLVEDVKKKLGIVK